VSTYGSAVYGTSHYGTDAITATAPGRAVRFLPALFTANKQNQLYDDISAQMDEGRVLLDLDLDGAKMSFEARMTTKRAVSPFVDFVAPFIRLVYEDGSEDYEQVGLFALVLASAEHYPGRAVGDSTQGGSFQQLDGRDLCWLLAADHATSTVNMDSGDNVIVEAIADLAAGGITRVNIPASAYTTSKDVSWPPGTSRLRRVNDRLMMAGYYTVTFDRHGIATSKPYTDLASAQPAVTYSGGTGSRIVPPIADTPDMTRFCNRVVVVGTDPALEPVYAIRENTDPLSPASFGNLGGQWISRTEENPEIQTQDAADALADALIRNGASYYRTLTIQTLPDPTRQPREVYGVELTNADGTVADGLWHCSGWELPIKPLEAMTHYLNREQALTPSTP
jgi:hypothetical protein